MQPTRIIARPLLASIFLAGGIDSLQHSEDRAKHASHVLDRVTDKAPEPFDDAVTLVRVNGGVQVVAASLLAVNKVPRLSSLALAATLVPTTIGGHAFWMLDDPREKAMQRLQFLKNCAVFGGLLLSAFDGTLSRREARALAKTATAAQAAQVARARARAHKGDVTGRRFEAAKERAARHAGVAKETARRRFEVAKQVTSKNASLARKAAGARASDVAKLGARGKSTAVETVAKVGALGALVKGLR